MRRVLIISPHFPPTNAPDHQRVRVSLPHFAACGWRATVLAVDAAQVEAPQDDNLARTLPENIEVHRVTVLPASLTRRFGIGNLGYRSWLALKRAGDRLLATGEFDLVYFSTTVFIATTLGRRWRQRFGVPFVVDIQDPWVTTYYDRPGAPRPPGGWKYRWARRQALRLEERAWRDAAGFITVSPGYLDDLGARYAWFSRVPAAVVPFGASERDFRFAAEAEDLRPAFARERDTLHLVSVGAIGPIMRPALEQLFASVAAWRARLADTAPRIRLHFFGTSYAPAGSGTASVQPVASAHGLSDCVTEVPDRIPFHTALKTLLAADAILLPGSDESRYSPSKLAQLFLVDRPVLAVVPEHSQAARQIAELGLTRAVASPGSPAANGHIAAFLDGLRSDPAVLRQSRNERAFAASYSAEATTRRQCELFDRALVFAAQIPMTEGT